MSRVYTVEELLAEVPGLSRSRLARLEAAEVVIRAQTSAGAATYRPVDRARLELTCQLGDLFDFDEDGLALVMNLVDRMHDARAELHALMRAVAAQPEPVRKAIAVALQAEFRGPGN